MDENSESNGRNERPPALGERAALTGYVAQYEVAAGILLQALTQETLEWIALVDPEAGRLDDFQLATPGQLDAFQIKWTAAGGQLSWADLRSLIALLVKERRKLADANVDRRTVAHLYCDRVASASALRVPGCRPGASAANAAAELLRPAAAGAFMSMVDIPNEWATVWAEVANESGLSPQDLITEFPNLRIELGQALPATAPRPGRDAAAYRRDLNDLMLVLFRVATDPRRLVRLSKDELLARLGDRWRRRLELASAHEFPAPLVYEAVASTTTLLKEALETHTTGYIALVGTPGSGKSTLLTQELRGRTDVVARYYAYVRGRTDVGSRRSEAGSFLHDMVLTLERRGLPRGPTPVDYDVDLLASRLERQLSLLGDRFRDEGVRSIIVVDGLDHVEREPGLGQPLLRCLPRPEALPEGVLMVVGSQTVRMLNADIRVQLEQPGRTIEMAGLERAAVARVAKAWGVAVPIAQLWRVTTGHPLILTYILEELRDTEVGDREAMLQAMPAYGGDVEILYARIWSEIEHQTDLVELLGLASRMRGPVDFGWLHEQGVSPALIRGLRDRLAHLFRREEERWHFFHESFRLFLQDRTSRVGGQPSPAEEHRFHRRLAEMCRTTPMEEPPSWELLFHLAGTEDHAAVLDIATPGFFRRQQLSLRPPELIQGDIQMAGRSLAAVHDTMALVRLVIAASEGSQRSIHAPDRGRFLELLVVTGDWRVAIEHMEAERESFGGDDPRTARLDISLALLDAGHGEAARQVFLSNEPLDVLSGRGEGRQHRDPHVLVYAWARCAAVLRGWNAVKTAADDLRLAPDPHGPNRGEQDPTPVVRAWMLAAGADELDRRGQLEHSEHLASTLDTSVDVERSPWLWQLTGRWQRHPEQLETLVAEATKVLQPPDLQPSDRLTIAGGLWKTDHRDEALRWIADVRQPHLSNEPGDTGNLWGAERFRYRLNRLLAASGERPAADTVIPPPERESDWGYVHAARLVVMIAQLEGSAWAGEDLEPGRVRSTLGTVLQTLEYEASADWSRKHQIGQVRAPALAALLEVAAQYGREAVHEVWAKYEDRWRDNSTLLLREGHRVLPAALNTGFIAPAVVEVRLRQLEELVQATVAGGSAASDLTELAETMVKVGLYDDAKRLVRQSVSATLSVYERKDYQISSWIELLGPRLDGESGTGLAVWLARALVELSESVGGAQAADAVRQLLLADGKRRPGHAWWLGAWLEEQGIVDWDDRAMTMLEAQNETASDPLWWTVLVDQVSPIAPEPWLQLLEIGANESVPVRGSAWLRERLSRLLTRVAIESPPHTRENWQSAIADCAATYDIAMSELPLPDEMHPTRRPPRSMSRGTDEQERDAFLAAHATVESLLEDAASADLTDWRSNWQEAVALNLAQMTLEDITNAATIFSTGERRLGIRVQLARRALELGATDVASKLAREVIDAAEDRSWLRNWDGGSLMGALRVLHQVDPRGARDLAYRRFAADAGSSSYLLSEAARELDEFLDLFGVDDRAAVGMEVEAYLRVLLPDPRHDPPAETPWTTDGAHLTLARIGIELLARPFRLAVSTAQRALADPVAVEDASVQSLIAQLLQSDDEELVLRALSVLESAVADSAAIADEVGREVDNWTTAENLVVRLAARRLGNALQRSVDAVRHRDLPPAYSIVVPENLEPIGLEMAAPLGRDDLERTIVAFGPELEGLAEAAGVNHGALKARVASIARQRAGADAIDDDRWKTSSSPLGWSFHKPSIRLWEQAVARVAAELVDSGRIDSESALRLSVGPGYDPALIRARPEAQPDAIRPLPAVGTLWISSDEWLEGLSDAHERLAHMFTGDWKVIGEVTELRRLDHEMPWERRAQAFGARAELDPNWRASSRMRTLVADIDRMPAPRDGNPLLYAWDVTYRGPTAWLTLHPRLADACGWTRDPDVLIGWRDNDGPLVRSTWWRSGWLDSARWADHDEVGEGWIVMLQPRALGRLEEVLGGTLGIAWQVERGFLPAGTAHDERSGVRGIE